MVALVALVVWRLPLVVVSPAYLIFGALNGLYLSSALTKIPDGAWFTLVLAFVQIECLHPLALRQRAAVACGSLGSISVAPYAHFTNVHTGRSAESPPHSSIW